MKIGIKLKEARIKRDMTQERVAEEMQVSRQTISNWENEKSYPDLVHVIKLGSLYDITLDELLKEDQEMIEHLEEITDIVKSNKNLMITIVLNIIIMVLIIVFASIISNNNFMMMGILFCAVISSATLFHQIIRKF